ncbi:hypothetical protein BDF22DRAFT_654125 [Syncephalis plumigaleata]|nr:hypothetical protein BDF22DRAFT_654125 [Syncephalis plumigaleata]
MPIPMPTVIFYSKDVTIEIIGRKTDNKSSGIEGQGELDIVYWKMPSSYSARRNNKPVDVRLLSNNLKTLAYKDYEQKIKIEYSEDEKKGRTSPRYNLKTNLAQQESATWQTKSPTRPDIIRVSLEPYNTPADNSNGFKYEIRNAVKNFTFADVMVL